MARISSVDYEAIPGQAKQMRSTAQQLNSEMTRAYQSITNMHSSWYGKRYNELVKSFNNLIPQINEMLQLVVTEIPQALETIANNYSQADRGTPATSVSGEQPNKIANIAITNDVGMKFITSAVQATQTSVVSNFKNATNQMNSIQSTYQSINWQSEAAEAFKAKFLQLKSSIVSSFESIQTQFSQLMTQTQQDIESTERANTVN